MIGSEDLRLSGPGQGDWSSGAAPDIARRTGSSRRTPGLRDIARRIFASARDLPILSPHGHTDPAWFATNAPWQDATSLLLVPDHYLYRMLYSQGVPMESLGIPGVDERQRHATPGRPGACSPATTTCSAVRRPRCGSTRCSRMSSASSTACRRRPRTTTTNTSAPACSDPSSGRGPSSSASTSRC